MAIQVNDYLCIHLEEVKVVPSLQYNMLLGCDVLHGDGENLGRARVDMMGTITWTLPKEGGSHHFSHLQPTPGGPRPAPVVLNAVHDKPKGPLPPPPPDMPNLLELEISGFTSA